MLFTEVPYVRMSRTQKSKALDILGRGNQLLKKWAVYFPPKKYRAFRNAVLNDVEKAREAVPEDRRTEFQWDLPFMRAIRFDRFSELDGRSAEQAILEGHSALAKKHARRWTLEGNPVGLTNQDFLQEAYAQVIEAMYAWLPNFNVDIKTFIWVSLKNRMSNVANQQGNLLCPLTNSDLKVKSEYDKFRREMGAEGSVEAALEAMKLGEESRLRFRAVLGKAHTETGAEKSFGVKGGLGSEEGEVDNDYTVLSRSQDDHVARIVGEQHVQDTLRRAGLTNLERELIDAAMNPYHGWQTEFAEARVNPVTGKPYSKAWITQLLAAARAKVAKAIRTSGSAGL